MYKSPYLNMRGDKSPVPFGIRCNMRGGKSPVHTRGQVTCTSHLYLNLQGDKSRVPEHARGEVTCTSQLYLKMRGDKSRVQVTCT